MSEEMRPLFVVGKTGCNCLVGFSFVICVEISSVGNQPSYKNPTANTNDYRNRGRCTVVLLDGAWLFCILCHIAYRRCNHQTSWVHFLSILTFSTQITLSCILHIMTIRHN